MSLSPSQTEDKRLLCEQVSAILQASGHKITPQVMRYMEPLLNGTLSFAEHRALLERKLS